ncbi:MAG: hypothetical protein EOO54_14835 [Haliea sp.]|nr:MAG: hypothetical protein EOO54_14835 [Haliea sp.]
MRIVRLALLGAPGTGKTALAGELAAAINANAVAADTVVIDDDPALLLNHGDAMAVSGNNTFQTEPASAAPYDLVLLMGLDLETAATPAFRQAQADADRAIRRALQASAIEFRVVYGSGEARLRNAWAAIAADAVRGTPATTRREQLPGDAGSPPEGPRRWVWNCDNCSDPQCEHQLFTRLRAERTRVQLLG